MSRLGFSGWWLLAAPWGSWGPGLIPQEDLSLSFPTKKEVVLKPSGYP